ncbi:MAG: FKBP-type peptidyl-prolyl cis-trans isomerase [Ferruginibacter sp.]
MNKRHFLILAIIACSFMLGSCTKDNGTDNNCVVNNTGVPTASEMASLQAFITANNLTATLHPDGFFYRILNPGSGATPTQASTITFKYTGTLTNGTIFDQNNTGAVFVLSQLILGFRRGIPLIQKGGSIILYIPPSLGYGCQQTGIIPPGSNLIFSVELVDVQ